MHHASAISSIIAYPVVLQVKTTAGELDVFTTDEWVVFILATTSE